MELMSESFMKKYLLNFACIISFILIFFLFWRYILPYILPFIIAYILSLFSRPILRRLDILGISRTFSSLLCTFFLFFGIGSLIFYISKGLFIQLLDFTSAFLESPDDYIEPFTKIISSLYEKYPKIFYLVDIESLKSSFLERLMNYAGAFLERTAHFALNTPNILLFLFATVFSTYYFIKSYGKGGKIISAFPKSVGAVVYYFKTLFVKYLKNYLFSMVIMLIIVFFLLLLGFMIMDFKYSAVLSFGVAIVDMLPVLGVGTFLIPLSIYYFIVGNYFRGVGLLVLYILILSVRQTVEPRIIGKKVGLSPLITLISVYVGFRAFGIMGLIFAPFIALAATSVLREYAAIKEGREERTP